MIHIFFFNGFILILHYFTHCDDLFLVVGLLLRLHAFYVQVDTVISQNDHIQSTQRETEKHRER